MSAPIACTLDGPDRAARGRDWKALRERARLGEHRTEKMLTTIWRRDEGVQAEVERLVAAERECCGFLSFELTVGDDSVTLVTAFPEGLSPEAWEW